MSASERNASAATDAGQRRPDRNWAAAAMFAAFALLPPVSLLLDDPFLVVIASRILVFAIAALSLGIILGYGAMVSLGHAAYIGIGAYSVAILSSIGVTDLFAHFAVAILCAGIFAAITGAISLRTQGVYFVMITLAFGQMAYFFFVSLSRFGGDDGTTLQNRSTLFGAPLLEDDLVLFYTALATLVLLFLFASRLVASRFGRVLVGTRDNMQRMEAIGFDPFRYRLVAYVIAGCMASVAGVLLANQSDFVAPAFMSWHRSGELIVMVVLGGAGNLAGTIAGAVIALLLEEWLALLTTHWKLLFGLALVAVALFSPGGISAFFSGKGRRDR